MSASPIASLILLLPVLASCELGDVATTPKDTVDLSAVPTQGSVPLGIVAGGIYESGTNDGQTASLQALATHADQILCEMAALGSKWIRIEAPWFDTSDATYQHIVAAARRNGMKVLVIVPSNAAGPECIRDDDPNLPNYLAKYRQVLERLGTVTFAGAAPDAWEITNEPNAEACGTGSRRVDGGAFGKFLRTAWDWKEETGRNELIVSGGVLNVILAEEGQDDAWWDALETELAGEKPFDLLGAHPYNPYSFTRSQLDDGCSLDQRPEECNGFPQWASVVKADLRALAARFGKRVLVSEVGWESCDPAISGHEMCAGSEELAAQGMSWAVWAMEQSAVVEAAIWYSYRDHEDGSADYGLRAAHQRDGAHEIKLHLAETFRKLAGGTDDDTCSDQHALESGIGLDAGGTRHQAIAECFTRNLGAAAVGGPSNNGGGYYVHDWGSVQVQDFDRGDLGPSMCILASEGGQAWMVRGGIRDAYLRDNGAPGWLGAPVAEEANSDGGPTQRFANGYIAWDHALGDFRGYRY